MPTHYRLLRDETVTTPSSDTLDYSVSEPAFLNRVSANGEVTPSLPTAKGGEGFPVYEHETKALPPHRSLAMQMRYVRTLWFAARLFANILFWYYLMPKLIGQDRVDAGSTGRFVKYARNFGALPSSWAA